LSLFIIVFTLIGRVECPSTERGWSKPDIGGYRLKQFREVRLTNWCFVVVNFYVQSV